MKKLILLLIILKLFSNASSQEVSIKEIFNSISKEFYTKNIDVSTDSTRIFIGFNFNKMIPSLNPLYNNTYIKLYYKNNAIKKISVIDTTEFNRNIDFDIVYSCEDFKIISIFLYYKRDIIIRNLLKGDTLLDGNRERETGQFFEGFMLHDKKRSISFILYEKQSNINFLMHHELKRWTKKSYVLSNWSKEKSISSISMILKLDRSLFPKERMVLHAGHVISCSEIGYGENGIYESIYLYSTELNKIKNLYSLSLNGLNELFDKYVNYGFRFGPGIVTMPLPYPREYLDEKPFWLSGVLEQNYYEIKSIK